MGREYYLDNAATTEVYSEVIDTISNVMRDVYGNPSSIHRKGNQAQEIVDKARQIIADYINCEPEEIIFTSGACEANSLAILGYMKQRWHGMTVFCTSPIEHKSIISIVDGYDFETWKADSCFEMLKVDENGFVDNLDMNAILANIYQDGYTPFVSIQAANSEIGTCQNIKEIAEITHRYGGIFHCDATQLFPYQRIDVKKLDIDMMSMSGQKIHAPKGIGFLYVKEGIELEPLIYGSQEKGIRGGTENVPYIAGLAKAIELLDFKFKVAVKPEIFHVRNYMEHQLKKKIIDCMINNDCGCCLPNLINISFKDIDAQDLITLLDAEDIYVSVGSACNSGSTEPSYVLKAINVPDEYIMGTIRITLPDDFEYDDVDYIVSRITYYVNNLRMFGEK